MTGNVADGTDGGVAFDFLCAETTTDEGRLVLDMLQTGKVTSSRTKSLGMLLTDRNVTDRDKSTIEGLLTGETGALKGVLDRNKELYGNVESVFRSYYTPRTAERM